MQVEAQGLRIADVVRIPMRGEGEVARREDFGTEVRIWFRGAEDDPRPSIVFDEMTILDIERPGSLFETPRQADRRELVRRVTEALGRVGWTFHAASGESVDHLHDPAGLVRVEFLAEHVVLFTKSKRADRWQWGDSGVVLGSLEEFERDFGNQIAKLETTALLLLWEYEADPGAPEPAANSAPPPVDVATLPKPEREAPLHVRYSLDEGVLICGDTKPKKDVIASLRTPYRFEYSPNLPEGCAWYVANTRGTYQPDTLIRSVVEQLRARGVDAVADYARASDRAASRTRDPKYPSKPDEQLAAFRKRLVEEGWSYHPPQRAGTKIHALIDPTDTVRLSFDGKRFEVEARLVHGRLISGWDRVDLYFDDLEVERDFEHGVRLLVAYANDLAARRALEEAEAATRYLSKDEQKPVPEDAEPLRIHYSREGGVLLCGNTYEHRAVIGKLNTPYRFKPSRNLPGDCYWFVPGTRGTFEPRSRLDNLATALRARGIATTIDYVDPEAIGGTPVDPEAKPIPVEARVEAIAERHGLITTRHPTPVQVEAALTEAVREGVGQDLRRWLTRTGKANADLATMLHAKARGRIALETNVWPPEGERGRYDVHEYEGVLASLAYEPTIAAVLAAAERWPSELAKLAGPEAPLLYARSELAFAKLVPETLAQRVDAAVRASFYAKGKKKAPPVPVTAKQVRTELVPRVEQLGRVMAATLDPFIYNRNTSPREIVDRLCKVSTLYAVHVLRVLRELPISSESEIEMVCRGARTLDSVLASNYRKSIDAKLAEADEIERTGRDARAIAAIAKGVEFLTVANFNAEYLRRYPDADPDWLMRRGWRQKPMAPALDKMGPAGQTTTLSVRGPIFGRQFNTMDRTGDERQALAAFLELIAHQDDPDGLAYVRGEAAELEAKAAAVGVATPAREVPKPVVVPPPMPEAVSSRASTSESTSDARIDALLATMPAITESSRPAVVHCYEAILAAEREGLGRAMRTRLVRTNKLDAGIGSRLLGRARAFIAFEAGAWPPKPIRGEAFGDDEFEGVIDIVAHMPEVAETLALAREWRGKLREIAGPVGLESYRNFDLEALTKQAHDLNRSDQIDRARSHARRGEPMTREVAQRVRDQIVARVKDRRVLLDRSLDPRLYDPETDRIWAKEALCKISPRVAERVLAEVHRVTFTDANDADRLCAGEVALVDLEMKAKAAAVERSKVTLAAVQQSRDDAQALLQVFEQLGGEPSIRRFNLAYWRAFPGIASYERDSLRLRAEHFDGKRMVERIGPIDDVTTIKVRGPKGKLFIVTGRGSEAELLELLRRHLQGVAEGDGVATAQARLDEARADESAAATASKPKGTPGRKPDRKKQADKLRTLARSMIKNADDEIAAPRQENTLRRAGIASQIRARAYGEQAIARTLLLAADEVERGELTYMARLSSRAQIEDLDSALQVARHKHQRALEAARDPEETRRVAKSEPREPILADVDYAVYRGLVLHSSQRRTISKARHSITIEDHADARLRAMLNVEEEFTTVRSEDIDLLRSTLQAITKASDKKIWDVQKTLEDIAQVDRLARLGVRDTDTLRAALREYVGCCRGQVEKRREDPMAARKRELQFMNIPGYFPTPRELAERLVSAAEIKPGMRVLEPSAGSGSIAEVIRERHPDATLELIEFNYALRQVLTDQGFTLLDSNDFSTFNPGERRYDRIVMNPPFEDRQDSGHIERALGMLAPGGRLVAIASGSFSTRSDKGSVALRGADRRARWDDRETARGVVHELGHRREHCDDRRRRAGGGDGCC